MQNKNKNLISSAIKWIESIENNPKILDDLSNDEKKQIMQLSQEIINILQKKERYFPVDAKIFNDLMSLTGEKEPDGGFILYPEERGKPSNPKEVEEIKNKPKFNRGYTV
jgi:hypothetical protein